MVFRSARQDEIGTDLGQRMEDKPAQMQTRMGQLQLRFIEHARPVIEQVEIDRAGAIALMLRRTPEIGFDFLQLLQQLPGRTAYSRSRPPR